MITPRRVAKFLTATAMVAVVVILAAVVWIVHSRSREQRLLARGVKLVPGSLFHANNFHWTQMKGDKEQWQLRAKEADYGADRKSAKLKDAVLTMTMDDGRKLMARADRVFLAVTGSHVDKADFSGHLVLEYDKMKLVAAQAVFFPDRDELDAPGPVSIVGQDFKISGVGLVAHPRAETMTVEAQVDTELVGGKHAGHKQQS